MEKEKTAKKVKILKLGTLILIICIFICMSVFLMPLLKNISTPQGQLDFKEKIQNARILGFFMLAGLELGQVIIAILPGEPIEVIAGMCYGEVGGTLFILLCTFACSCIIFFSVKKFGRNFVYEFFSKEKIEKIENNKILKNPKKIEKVFWILFLIPGTPKDLLTYVAGLLPINSSKFLLISTVGRIPSIVSSTIAGANLIKGSWKIAILSYLITFFIIGVGMLLYKLLIKDQDAEKAMKDL